MNLDIYVGYFFIIVIHIFDIIVIVIHLNFVYYHIMYSVVMLSKVTFEQEEDVFMWIVNFDEIDHKQWTHLKRCAQGQ